MISRNHLLAKLFFILVTIFFSTKSIGLIMQNLVKTNNMEQGYFYIDSLTDEQLKNFQKTHNPYYEFIRTSSISTGLYVIPINGQDHQEPHTADELYYVIKGKSGLTVGDKEYVVNPGSIIYVAKGVDHRFHNITQDLTVMVFFGPSEKTPKIRWLIRKGLSAHEISEILDVDIAIVDAILKNEKGHAAT